MADHPSNTGLLASEGTGGIVKDGEETLAF